MQQQGVTSCNRAEANRVLMLDHMLGPLDGGVSST